MQVKTIDYTGKDAPAEFTRSLKETGFAVLCHHPVTQAQIDEVYAGWEHFFNSENKDDFHYVKPSQAGYAPLGTEGAKDSRISDLKEFFNYYPNGPVPEQLRKTTHNMFDSLYHLAVELLQWIEDHLPKEISSKLAMPLSDMIKGSKNTMLRIIHYPPMPDKAEEGAIRAGAHEDINLITIIPAASAQGLQVQDACNQWHEVPCESGNIVVNVGDMLQMCTEHYYQSTTHRVINPEGEAAKVSRYSMPLFLHPEKSVPLSSTHTASSYLVERLREIGVY